MRLTLTPHPDTPCAPVREISVEVSLAGDQLDLRYIVTGDPSAVLLPEPADPARTDDLWKHTCFEAFLRPYPPSHRSSRRKSGSSVPEVADSSPDENRNVPGPNPLDPDPRSEHRTGEGDAYNEFNLSPSGCWAAYSFTDYRAGMTSPDTLRLLHLSDRRAPDRYDLSARVEVVKLSNCPKWALGLSAVIELQDKSKSYWALRHPPGKPDFHHPHAFAHTLFPESP